MNGCHRISPVGHDIWGDAMECRENRFCRSLDEATRCELCKHCTLRPFKKGQVVYRADIEPYITVVVEGVMTTQQNFDSESLADGDCPAFFINTSGLVLGVEGLFNEKPIERYGYIHYEWLSDGVTARFDRAFVRSMFEANASFARALYQNIVTAAGEACEFAAVLRASSVDASIEYLLWYAARKGMRLTQQQMADITGHSRVSVTKALSRIKENKPALWSTYESSSR